MTYTHEGTVFYLLAFFFEVIDALCYRLELFSKFLVLLYKLFAIGCRRGPLRDLGIMLDNLPLYARAFINQRVERPDLFLDFLTYGLAFLACLRDDRASLLL